MKRLVLTLVLVLFSLSLQAQYRFWYVTDTNHSGNETLTACAEGYHFASITELSNPSGLVYDVKADLGGLSKFDPGHTGTIAWLDFDTNNLNPWELKWVGQKLSCDTQFRVHCVSDIIQPPPPEVLYCNGFEACPSQ